MSFPKHLLFKCRLCCRVLTNNLPLRTKVEIKDEVDIFASCEFLKWYAIYWHGKELAELYACHVLQLGFLAWKVYGWRGDQTVFARGKIRFWFFFFSFSNSSTYTWEFLKPFSLCCNIMYFDMLRHLALINKDQTTVLRNYWRLQIKSNTGSFKPSFIALVLTTMDHKWLQDFRASLILVFIYSVHIPAKFRCNISKLIPEIFFSSFHL